MIDNAPKNQLFSGWPRLLMPGGKGQLIPVICACINGLIMLFVVFPVFLSRYSLPLVPEAYVQMVLDLVNGNGLRWEWEGATLVMAKEPGYILFLTMFYVLFGNLNALPVQITQIFMNACICWIVWMIAYMSTERRDVAAVAAMGYAFHPLPLWYSVRIWNDIPASLLVVLSVLLLMISMKKGSRSTAALAGFALAAATLFRIISVGLLFVFLIVLMLPSREEDLPKNSPSGFGGFAKRSALAGVLVVAFLCVISPWAIRNFSISGRPVLLTIQGWGGFIDGGENVKMWDPSSNVYAYVGEERKHRLVRDLYAEEILRRPDLPSARIELIVNDSLKRTALREVCAEPLQFAKKVFLNVLFFWYLGSQKLMSMLMMLVSVVLIPMAAVGVVTSARRRNFHLIGLASLVGFFWAVQSLVIGYGRYSVSVLPYVVILAAFAWAGVLKRIHFLSK
jgi:hypothetical protein